MRLDHLSYAAGPEGLEGCAERLGAQLGGGFRDGGVHPSFGTRTVVLALAHGCYVEVVEALEHPSLDLAAFGRAVRDRSAAGGGWLTWVVAVDDVAPLEQRFGRSAALGHRRRPDGAVLRWQQFGVNALILSPQLPLFLRWLADPADHPSAGGSDVRLKSVEISGRPAAVAAYLGVSTPQPLDGLTVEWRDGDRGLVAATFETPAGEVRIV
jgi:hypothetical protein